MIDKRPDPGQMPMVRRRDQRSCFRCPDDTSCSPT